MSSWGSDKALGWLIESLSSAGEVACPGWSEAWSGERCHFVVDCDLDVPVESMTIDMILNEMCPVGRTTVLLLVSLVSDDVCHDARAALRIDGTIDVCFDSAHEFDIAVFVGGEGEVAFFEGVGFDGGEAFLFEGSDVVNVEVEGNGQV